MDEDTKVRIEAGGRTVDTTLAYLSSAAKAAAAPQLGDVIPSGFVLSQEVEAVALQVIDSDPRFMHVPTFRIAYALEWGKDPTGRGGIHVLAKAVKAPGLWRDLGAYDVVVHANQRAWQHLTAGQRQALVAHELCHVGQDDKGGLVLLEHDIEEFGWVARRYGQWHSALEFFAQQLGLGLTEPLPAPAD